MSREIEPFSDLAELRRIFGDDYSDSDYEEASGADGYGGVDDDRYDCGGFSTRGGGGARAFCNDFGQSRMPFFRGRARTRPFVPRGDFGYERGGVPSRGCRPWLGRGRAPLRPPARGGWSQSPRCNRGDPPSQRRPFFRGRGPQAERPPRYPRIRGGGGGAFNGTRGPRRGFGVRLPLHGNNGTSSRDYDHTGHGGCRDEAFGGPQCPPDRDQQERPQWRQRGRSVTPPTRPDAWRENWRTRTSQGARESDNRGGWWESRSFYSRSGSSDSESDRGRSHPSRDSGRETTMATSSSRVRSRNIAAENSHRFAVGIARESRELTRGAKTGTRIASPARTERPREEDSRSKRPGDPLPLGARSHHDNANKVLVKPTVRKVADSMEPLHNQTKKVSDRPTVRKVTDSVEPAAVATSNARTLGAKDEGQKLDATRRTKCPRQASSSRPSTTKRPPPDTSPLRAKKVSKSADLQIADESYFSPISDDSTGDREDGNVTEPGTGTSERPSLCLDDVHAVRQCTPEFSSPRTLLPSPDSTTDPSRDLAVCEDVPCEVVSTEDPTETADSVLSVVETSEGPKSSEEVEFPEVEVDEEVMPSQDDDAYAEESSEMSDTAACVEFPETLQCEPGLDAEHESGSSAGESGSTPLADGEQDAASVVSYTSPSSTSAVSTDEDSASVPQGGSAASEAVSASSAGVVESQWVKYCREALRRLNNDQEKSSRGNAAPGQNAALAPSKGMGAHDARSEASSATTADCEQDTASFVSTKSDEASAVAVSEDVPAATFACQNLQLPGPSTEPYHSGQGSKAQQQLHWAATSLLESGPSRDAGATCEASPGGTSTEGVLFELNAFTAMSVHEFFEDEAAKKQTLAWYVTGRRTNTRQACADEMRKLLAAAARSERAKRRNLSNALRRLVQFQSTLPRLSPDTSPRSQERES